MPWRNLGLCINLHVISLPTSDNRITYKLWSTFANQVRIQNIINRRRLSDRGRGYNLLILFSFLFKHRIKSKGTRYRLPNHYDDASYYMFCLQSTWSARHGAADLTSSSPSSHFPLALATSGGFHTSATKMAEVCRFCCTPLSWTHVYHIRTKL